MSRINMNKKTFNEEFERVKADPYPMTRAESITYHYVNKGILDRLKSLSERHTSLHYSPRPEDSALIWETLCCLRAAYNDVSSLEEKNRKLIEEIK